MRRHNNNQLLTRILYCSMLRPFRLTCRIFAYKCHQHVYQKFSGKERSQEGFEGFYTTPRVSTKVIQQKKPHPNPLNRSKMTPIFKICPKTAFLVSGQKKNFFTSAQEFFKSGQIVCLRPYRAPQGIKVLGKYHLKVKICTGRPQSKLDCENLVSGKNACFFKFSKEGPISWLIKTLCIFKLFLYDPTQPSGSEYIPLETPVCIR